MTTSRRLALIVPALLLAPVARAQAAAITGTATHRERIAIPPGSVLEVALLDIARQGAPAERIATATIPVERQAPIPFTLPYDPARITPMGRYAVRAVLRGPDGTVMFRTTQIHPVLSGGAGNQVELLLRADRAGRSQPPTPTPTPAPDGLGGPSWVAEDIGGRGVVDRSQSTIVFGANGRAMGRAGCNRFNGRYQADGAAMRIGPLVTTRMACTPDALRDQERRFLAALDQVRGWRIERGLLFLTDEAGAPALRFSRLG